MKHLTTLCLLAFSLAVQAQSENTSLQLTSVGNHAAQASPVPAGEPELLSLETWPRYSSRSALLVQAGMAAARQGMKPGIYLIRVRFTVGADGKVYKAGICGQSRGFGLEDAALQLLRESGAWMPVEGWVQVPVRIHVFE